MKPLLTKTILSIIVLIMLTSCINKEIVKPGELKPTKIIVKTNKPIVIKPIVTKPIITKPIVTQKVLSIDLQKISVIDLIAKLYPQQIIQNRSKQPLAKITLNITTTATNSKQSILALIANKIGIKFYFSNNQIIIYDK